MEQKVIISNLSDIEQIAHDISLFNSQKKVIKVHLNQFTEAENRQIEHEIVKQCAAGSRQLDGRIGLFTMIIFLALMAMNIIPAVRLGVFNLVLLYLFFTTAILLGTRLYRLWQAKKALNSLVRELPAAPSFGYL